MSSLQPVGQVQTFRQRKPILWARWNVNPYIAEHSHKTKTRRQGESLPTRLDRLLSKRRDNLPDPVIIGQGGEPYLGVEKKQRITHQCLEVLAKHGCPEILSTGSALVLRDIDLIRELHEDSMATIGLRLPMNLFSRDQARTKANSPSAMIALLERICRSGVQTGMILEPSIGQPVVKRRLVNFFKIASQLSIDFIDIPSLRIPRKKHPINRLVDGATNADAASGGSLSRLDRISLRVKKSILQLSQEYSIRITPKRFLPKDTRLENFWLAEALANHAYQLELSGVSSSNHWAAARRIDNLEGDIRLKALRGELAQMTSNNPIVQNDVERFLRGERNISFAGYDL